MHARADGRAQGSTAQVPRREPALAQRRVCVAEFLVDAADSNGIADARGVCIGVRYTHQLKIADDGRIRTRDTLMLTLGEMRRQTFVCFDHRRHLLDHEAARSCTKLV